MKTMVSVFLAAALMAGVAQADTTTTVAVPASAYQNLAITVPAGARTLTVTATSDAAAPGDTTLYLQPDSKFSGNNPSSTAAYYSTDASGTASIAIADWSQPGLHPGTWHVAVANASSVAENVTVTSSVSDNDKPDTVFSINFGPPSAALKSAEDWTDDSDCDVAPWSDTTPLDSNNDGTDDTTLGAFRKNLLIQATQDLAPQVHSLVPITIQACWKAYGDKDDALSYTLAAAGPLYIFQLTPAGQSPTWYVGPATSRLFGTSLCNLTSSVNCGIPDIIVQYNSDPVAAKSYDDVSDEPLIISTTIHELTHGLGFTSQASLSYDDDGASTTPNVPVTKEIGVKLASGIDDAFSAQVGWVHPVSAASTNEIVVTPFASLSPQDRFSAVTSGSHLVMMDKYLAANPENALKSRPYPDNLVELYAPASISLGSTLSHFNDAAHPGQLMDHFIQHNHPTTLGLAAPVLAKAGWSTVPTGTPIATAWYDPNHSGHGFDIEPVTVDAGGNLYSVIMYTYDNSDLSAFWFSSGRLRYGHYESIATPGAAAPIARPVYDPASKKATYPGQRGTLSIDFSAAAKTNAACADSISPNVALAQWSINGDSGTWCLQPALVPANHPDVEHDVNGLWNHGAGDSGWGFSVVQTATGTSTSQINLFLLYYYDQSNHSHWAQADTGSGAYAPGVTYNLYSISGYCRTCAKVKVTPSAAPIGTITLNLYGGDAAASTVSVDIQGAGFTRTDVGVHRLSLPPSD